MSLFGGFFQQLEQERVRYVVVGGLAAVLHGHARLTADIDLALDLEPLAARHAMEVLAAFGLRPRAPVDPLLFADPTVRSQWIEDKGLRVFSLWCPGSPLLEVDLFVEHPIPFPELWEESELVDAGVARIRIASIRHLIALKRLAGRAQDELDIEVLEAIQARRQAGHD
jgi:hypothetical protein